MSEDESSTSPGGINSSEHTVDTSPDQDPIKNVDRARLEDQPLCVEINLKSMLCRAKVVNNMEFHRIIDVISSCMVDDLDMNMARGSLRARSLTCIRVLQYQNTTTYSVGDEQESGFRTNRPRILRYHFPYIFSSPVRQEQACQQYSEIYE